MLDINEEATDTDSDGFYDVFIDTDGDGLVNRIDEDDDGDGYETYKEDYNSSGGRGGDGDPMNDDFDGDGIADYLDDDDDDDGVPSFYERKYDLLDPGDPSDNLNHRNIDSDNDDIDDLCEWDFPACAAKELPADFDKPQNWDLPADLLIDALDSDDDNDGIPTLVEGADSVDAEPPEDFQCDVDPGWGSGRCEPYDDTDPDHPDLTVRSLGLVLPNYLDLDSDNDGKLDSEELTGDDDNDGVPNFLDCNDCDGPNADPDQDGIVTRIEVSLKSDPFDPDTDGDGVYDNFELIDLTPDETDITRKEWESFDTDGDGKNDVDDVDDDGDGVNTIFELNPSERTDYTDDGDPSDAENTDGDDEAADAKVPDYLDNDDDGDTLLTKDELNQLGRDENSDPPYVDDGDPSDADDTDGDGIPDYRDPDDIGPLGDLDSDGLINEFEDAIGSSSRSTDTDGDGVLDADEVDTSKSADDQPDTDGDGIIDVLDTDDDGDGIDTADEGSWDFDGDGIPNHLDTDSDNDGIPDAEETGDADGDGIPDYIDITDDSEVVTDCSDPEQWNTYDCEPREAEAPCACSGAANTPQGYGFAALLLGGLAFLRRRRR